MAQRGSTALRAACRALSALTQGSTRQSSGSNTSNLGFAALKSVLQSRSPSAAAACSSMPMLRSMRPSNMQVPAFSPVMSMGFAASAPTVSCGLSLLSSISQHRGMATGDLSEDGDGEEAGETYKRGAYGPQNALPLPKDNEPPDLEDLMRELDGGGGGGADEGARGAGGPPRGGPGGGAMAGARDDAADPLELVALARAAYLSKSDKATGLPLEVRQAMYGSRWDKVLVDCRRTVDYTTNGKKEVYTSMVAVGNMKGLLGLGVGVADTAQVSTARAHLDAFSRLTAVPLYRGHTIYHHIDHTFHKLQMRLMPRPEGWGLHCSDLVYELCNVVGIRNLSVKMRGGRRNKLFVAQCFLEALQRQTTPHDGVEATGVYMREVYYRKQLPCGLKRGADLM